ncbi:MAG TPA: hypothetical protein VEA44_10420 [Caulobacter sp.]|nr:hypothetical protein [Caulobacter sp.]
MDEDPLKRHTFVVEAAGGPDVLLRVLGPFALQEATITDLRLDRRADAVSLFIEASGVTDARAALIARRLEGLAAVRGVGLGWRSGDRSYP